MNNNNDKGILENSKEKFCRIPAILVIAPEYILAVEVGYYSSEYSFCYCCHKIHICLDKDQVDGSDNIFFDLAIL